MRSLIMPDNQTSMDIPPMMDIPPQSTHKIAKADLPPSDLPHNQEENVSSLTAGSVTSSPTSAKTDKPVVAQVKTANETRPEKPQQSSSSSVLLTILGLVALIIVSGVIFLYLGNKRLKDQSNSISFSPTPTPQFNPDLVQIFNGNVTYTSGLNSNKILVDKNLFPNTGITGFTRVMVSPDGKKICFESWPPAPIPALYLANSDGTNAVEIKKNAKSCYFSQDGQMIIYSRKSDDQKVYHIYSFNPTTQSEVDLTKDLVSEDIARQYEIVRVKEDKIICNYSDINLAAGISQNKSCEIPIPKN